MYVLLPLTLLANDKLAAGVVGGSVVLPKHNALRRYG